MISLIDLFFNLDNYIGDIIQNYGVLTYLILFLIIFSETGLVIFTFFPGDTLLFVAGTFASIGAMNIFVLFALLSCAAILGDTVNYFIGEYFGKKILEKRKWISQENIDLTKRFFEKHGGKTIIIARFVPIIRSFAPFVAGIGKMNYRKFLIYNVIGAILWTFSMLTLGYFFGTIPFVKENLSFIILIIVIISWIFPIITYIQNRKK